MCGQRYSEVMCAFSVIKFLIKVSAILGIARLKVNQNTRPPPLSENLNWVVPEKIRTPPTDGILEILTGGGVKDPGNPGRRGG